MKNLILITLFVFYMNYSNSQNMVFNITKKSISADSKKTTFNAQFLLKDNTIEILELGLNKVYSISKKEIYNDNILLINATSDGDNYEFLIYKDPKMIQVTRAIKRLSIDKPDYVSTFYHYVKNYNQYHSGVYQKQGSFGAFAGLASIMGSFGDSYNFSGGSWFQYKSLGFEYVYSGSVTNDLNATDYLNGRTDSWSAGGYARSFGVLYCDESGYYIGGGAQFTNLVGVKNGAYGIPTVTNDFSTFPYFSVGYLKNINPIFTFKGGLQFSKIISLNAGIGLSF